MPQHNKIPKVLHPFCCGSFLEGYISTNITLVPMHRSKQPVI
jgi:hypothetical protein